MSSAMGAATVIPACDAEHAGQFMALTLEATIGSLQVSYAPNPWAVTRSPTPSPRTTSQPRLRGTP